MVAGGWPEVSKRNHDLALRGRDVLCRALGIDRPAPDGMLGSMAAMPLPRGPDHPPPTRYHDALQDALVERHGIQVPVWSGGGTRLFRISAQLYNSPEQYEYLARALVQELEREGSRR